MQAIGPGNPSGPMHALVLLAPFDVFLHRSLALTSMIMHVVYLLDVRKVQYSRDSAVI